MSKNGEVSTTGTIVDNSQAGKTTKDKFEKLTDRSQQIIYKARSVFPFDLFPDEIVIDENKVDMSFKKFFRSREVYSVPLQNINGARSSSSLIFANISIEIDGYNQNPPTINYLWKADAIIARRIINGLVTAIKQGIDLSELDLKSLREELIKIGRASDSSAT